MSKLTHSPAPWRWWPCTAPGGDYAQIASGKMQVAQVKIVSVTEEDLRLMVAAPELLAALQGVLRVADRATDEFDAARAAITKATGGAA